MTLEDITEDIPHWKSFKKIFLDLPVLPQRYHNTRRILGLPRKSNMSGRNDLNATLSTQASTLMEQVFMRSYYQERSRTSYGLMSQDSTLKQSIQDLSISRRRMFDSTEPLAMDDLSQSSRLPSSPQFKSSGNEELTRILRGLLEEKGHIVQIIMSKFHSRFDGLFSKRLRKLTATLIYSQEDNNLYECIEKIVRTFLSVTKRVLLWMYQDLIRRAKEAWVDDYLSSSWVIDSILSEILFSSSTSTLNSLVRHLLTKKHSKATRKLQEMFNKQRKLDDDSDLADNYPLFTLKGSETPYEEVVKKISELSSLSNPYQTFEIITSLEKEIITCANLHYANDTEMNIKLADKFDREVKIAVLLYCIQRSRNINLVVDIAVVEGFVSKRYLDSKQSFSSFTATLDFLLEDDDL